MGKGQTNFLPDKKNGFAKDRKVGFELQEVLDLGWMYLRAKIEKEKLACVDMNMDNMV